MTREETIHELGEWLEQMIQHGVPSHSAKRKALATAIALLSAEPSKVDYRTDESANIGTEVNGLISRADAIEAVMAEGRKVYTSEYANAERIIYEADAVETLSMLPSADAVQGWIPCSERSPEKDGWYLITVQGYEKVVDMEWYYSEWGAWNGVSSEQQVIAWMPLPKPYERREP